jgi:anti-sigma factor RsiW
MSAASSSHPDVQILQSYGLGKLDGASAQWVSKHLKVCADCRTRVAEISSDSFLDRLRDAQGHAENATVGRRIRRYRRPTAVHPWLSRRHRLIPCRRAWPIILTTR